MVVLHTQQYFQVDYLFLTYITAAGITAIDVAASNATYITRNMITITGNQAGSISGALIQTGPVTGIAVDGGIYVSDCAVSFDKSW